MRTMWKLRTRISTGADKPAQVKQAHDRRPAIAAGLSFLWPGLGHLFLGRRREAAILAGPAFLIALLAVIQLSQGALWFVFSLWDQSYFLAVAAAVLIFGALRVVAVGHSFMSASPAPRSRPRQLAFGAILVAVIVATHGLFIAGTFAWYQTSVTIQNNDPLGLRTSHPLAGASSPSLPAWIQPGGIAGASGQPIPAPTGVRNPNRITFVVIGVDSLAGQTTLNTDTMMLVSIDMTTEQVAMVSVPRDTTSFQLYYGPTVANTLKLNSLLAGAMSKNFGSPDDAITTLEKEIGFLVGLPVDYYAYIGLAGLAGMIDTLGGVDVYNPRAISDAAISLPAGQIHLDGATAIAYVRSRETPGDSDYDRATRQQGVLIAARNKIISPTGLSRIGSLLSEAGQDIGTDFPLNTARNYVTALVNISKIESCVLGPPYSIHPDMSLTGGTWTSYLDMGLVANLSVGLFGQDSTYYGKPGVVPAACAS
jgi:LCP family protein required for cell wall assembly